MLSVILPARLKILAPHSSPSGIREEDDVEIHIFEEERDSSQNCHPLEVPPLARNTSDISAVPTGDSFWVGYKSYLFFKFKSSAYG